MAEDDKPSQPAIPAWQQKPQQDQNPLSEPPQSASSSSPATSDTEPTVVHDSTTTTTTSSATDPLPASSSASYSKEEVQRFLLDPAVRDAPDSAKRSFLISKGVPQSVIDDILLSQASQPTPSFSTTEFASSHPSSSAPRDNPPIVTYPEFLLKPTKPPPLVTLPRLLNTAYVFGSLALIGYGVTTYLIKPMSASLTHARHDLALHADARTQALNAKLEKVVSRVPPPKKPSGSEEAAAAGAEAKEESEAGDPTELFYADVGVQTSPPASRRSSTTTTTSSSAEEKAKPEAVHTGRLTCIREEMEVLLSAETRSEEVGRELDESVAGLREYLNGLVYSPPANMEFGVWNPALPQGGKSDAVGKLRDEIRGVKGVLLSARRFPARGAVRTGA
ncbi:hypothetical protein K461DRAFT_290059 [Myriangium duriaei CBS 260.36]|uniref:Peroxisome membrane anchor protein Pex14p N-terminal domain-containing protein n=1 Tax=Myriangium duriaei CBS 260.36 TaxID=1168546 RepID=A0A9P4J9G3_9PEZI|nr:hypothetical protein K461DRAFT_290059 [Myriangium duriaei CBS 260.36]